MLFSFCCLVKNLITWSIIMTHLPCKSLCLGCSRRLGVIFQSHSYFWCCLRGMWYNFWLFITNISITSSSDSKGHQFDLQDLDLKPSCNWRCIFISLEEKQSFDSVSLIWFYFILIFANVLAWKVALVVWILNVFRANRVTDPLLYFFSQFW